MRRMVLVALFACAAVFLALSPAPSAACPFCIAQGTTLTTEVTTATMVIYGTLANARLGNEDALDGGATDLIIEDVVKTHPYLKDKKSVVLPKYIPVEKDSKVRFLVFCDYYKDKLDPYRGLPVKEKAIVDYLKGAVGLKDKDPADRLAFFFRYLDNADTEVSSDAYKEFAAADAKAVAKMLEQADRAKLAAQLTKWIKDEQTPSYRYGLYGYMLGLCGTAKDAPVLKELLDDPQRGLVSGIDGILAGYISLQPKEGWQYLLDILKDPKPENSFTRRYAGLRTLRHYWDNPIDTIQHKDVLSAIAHLLEQNDIADLAIEDLRKWKQWQMSDKILGYYDKPSHNVPIISRSILRFALSCPPEIKRAAAFVEEQRRKDADKVKDVEELLKFETPLNAAEPAKNTAGN